MLDGDACTRRARERAALSPSRPRARARHRHEQVLAYLHGKGVVHRSLGPSSLLLSTSQQDEAARLTVRLVDLGFAASASSLPQEEVESAMRRGASSPLAVLPMLALNDLHGLGYVLLELFLASAAAQVGSRVGEGVPSGQGCPELGEGARGRESRATPRTPHSAAAPGPAPPAHPARSATHGATPTPSPRHRTPPMRTRRARRSCNLSSGWSRTSTRATCAGASASSGSCREQGRGAGPWCRAEVQGRGGEQGRGGRPARVGPLGGSLGHALALKAASEEPTRRSPCRLALDAGTAPRSRRGPARWRCSTRRTARGGACCSRWSTAARASSPAA